jgi:hypothetical protein
MGNGGLTGARPPFRSLHPRDRRKTPRTPGDQPGLVESPGSSTPRGRSSRLRFEKKNSGMGGHRRRDHRRRRPCPPTHATGGVFPAFPHGDRTADQPDGDDIPAVVQVDPSAAAASAAEGSVRTGIATFPSGAPASGPCGRRSQAATRPGENAVFRRPGARRAARRSAGESENIEMPRGGRGGPAARLRVQLPRAPRHARLREGRAALFAFAHANIHLVLLEELAGPAATPPVLICRGQLGKRKRGAPGP